MSARDDIARVAREHGWDADWYESAGEFSRGRDRVNVVFDRAGRITSATSYFSAASDSIASRDKGKRETVILWLEATDATDDDGQQTEWCTCTDAPNPDWHDDSCALALAERHGTESVICPDDQRAIVDAYPLDAQDDDVTEQCIDHGTTGGDCELCAETIESAHESEREAWQMTMTIDDDPCTYDQAINLPPAYLPVLDKAFRDNASEVATRLTSLPVLRASITRVETHHPITGTMRRMYQAVVQLDNASRDADLYATAIFRPV